MEGIDTTYDRTSPRGRQQLGKLFPDHKFPFCFQFFVIAPRPVDAAYGDPSFLNTKRSVPACTQNAVFRRRPSHPTNWF